MPTSVVPFFPSADGERELAVTEANPLPVSVDATDAYTGAANISTEQEALSTTAEAALAARATRRSVLVQNLDTAETVWVGANTSTGPTTGIRLLPGESVRIYTTAAIWAEAGANTPTVAFLEEYD